MSNDDFMTESRHCNLFITHVINAALANRTINLNCTGFEENFYLYLPMPSYANAEQQPYGMLKVSWKNPTKILQLEMHDIEEHFAPSQRTESTRRC